MAKAYSYIRFSTPEQIKGDSLRRQIEASEHYAAKQGLTLDSSLSFRDLGISAFNKSNLTKGALGEFLKLVQDGRIESGSTLLVENLDRLSRGQITDALDLFLSLIKSGITIVTLMDEGIYNKESINNNFGQLFMSIGIMLRAADESATKSKRIRASWDNKRATIQQKRLTKRCPYWLQPSRSELGFELIPERVEIVKRIFEMAKNGFGNSLITKTLNEQNIKPFSSKSDGWQTSYIQKLLRNPAIYGDLCLQTQRDGQITPIGEPIKNYYPAVIAEDEWLLVNSVREARTTRGGSNKGKHVSNIFSGLLFCGHCNGSLNMGAHTKKKTDGEVHVTKYVSCSRARRGLGCLHITWTYSELEKEILSFCDTLDFKTILSDGKRTPTELETITKEILSTNSLLQKNAEKLNRLLDLIESDSNENPKSLLSRIGELDREQSELEIRKQSLQAEFESLSDALSTGEETAELVMETLHQLRNLEGHELRELRLRLATQLRRTVEKIVLYPAGPWVHPDKRSEISKNLKKSGYSVKEIAEYLTNLSIPKREDRYMVITFKNGEAVSIQPTQTTKFTRLPKGAAMDFSAR